MRRRSKRAQIGELRAQVSHLHDTLEAIRVGTVDGVLAAADGTDRIYTLETADRPYRVILESLGVGAATVSDTGVVLFANRHLCGFLGAPPDRLVGSDFGSFLREDQRIDLDALLVAGPRETRRAELVLRRADGTTVPALVAVTAVELGGQVVRCLVFTDLTMQKRMERQLAGEEARSAERAERQRVAREFHDTIVQGLVTAEMALDLELLEQARTVLARTSTQARDWVGELADDDLLGMVVGSAASDRRDSLD